MSSSSHLSLDTALQGDSSAAGVGAPMMPADTPTSAVVAETDPSWAATIEAILPAVVVLKTDNTRGAVLFVCSFN